MSLRQKGDLHNLVLTYLSKVIDENIQISLSQKGDQFSTMLNGLKSKFDLLH